VGEDQGERPHAVGGEREILDATRALFDARGVRDAQIEDIARAVGINRAIVYRHFTGKEELFALTLTGYLDELRDALAQGSAHRGDPAARRRLDVPTRAPGGRVASVQGSRAIRTSC